ncbi:MAG: anti-sigma factor domain-containing protein [Burkholderiales bacterium]|jgi:anti-sigma-K factor RskA
MIDERKLDLVVLAALGALDGEDRAAFEALAAKDPEIQREVAAYRELVGRIGTATAPVPPPKALRERLLRETRPAEAPRSWLSPALAAALVASIAGLALVFAQRNAARREAAFERAAAQEARQVAQRAQAEAASLREALAIEVAFRELVIRPQSRVVSLAGLAPAPQANARVVWHAERREAVLLASGLAPAPAGKAYELWIIAKAAPVPAGVFQVDPQGRAVFRLPAGLDFAGVKTFAVTLEPEAGVPAPTGPMVLAGAVS